MGQEPRQLWRPDSQTTPISEKARRLPVSGDASSQAPYVGRRVGWLAVGIAVAGVLSLAVLVSPDLSDRDPADAGWGEILFVISPFFAVAGAFVIGLVLVVVAALRFIPLSAGRAARAMGIGVIAGPIFYIAAIMAISSAIASAFGLASAFGITSAAAPNGALSSQILGFMTFELPVICGIGVTLFAALRKPRGPGQRPIGWAPGPDSSPGTHLPSAVERFEIEPPPVPDSPSLPPSDAIRETGSGGWVAVAVVILLVLPVYFTVFLIPALLVDLAAPDSIRVPEPVTTAIAMLWFALSLGITTYVLRWVYRRLRRVIARIDDAIGRRRAARATRSPKPSAAVPPEVVLPASLSESGGPDPELVAEMQRWRRERGNPIKPAPKH